MVALICNDCGNVRLIEVVAIVGVKVRPHDRHLWDAIAATSAEVIYCAGKAAGQEFATWASHNRPGRVSRVLSTYFSEGFDELCASIGLAGATTVR